MKPRLIMDIPFNLCFLGVLLIASARTISCMEQMVLSNKPQIMRCKFNDLDNYLIPSQTNSIQQMEPTPASTPGPKIADLLAQISAGLDDYYRDRSRLEVWNKVFWVIGIYVTKQGPISAEAQKVLNYYLQNKSESSVLGPLIVAHKEIISKIYDYGISYGDTIDATLSTGALRDIVNKKLEKQLAGQKPRSSIVKVLHFCIEQVALHFCDFLSKFKQANGTHLQLSNRKITKVMRQRQNLTTETSQLMNETLRQPLTLLNGYIENIKPMLSNYLNMQTLFELTSREYKKKKVMIVGYLASNSSSEVIGKTVNLNSIFDASYTGREMIEKKLSALTLEEGDKADCKCYWSLTCKFSQFEPYLPSIFQRLPNFLRPKSYMDILSYLRKPINTGFKYQVFKSGYVQGPFLSQATQVYANVGKNIVQIISFHYSKQTEALLKKNQKDNVFQIIQKLNVKYSKAKLLPKSIAVIPSNNYYILAVDPEVKNLNTFSEVILWETLPKDTTTIKACIEAYQTKIKNLAGYYFLPLQIVMMDFISHQYSKIKDQELTKTVVNFLEGRIANQEKLLYQLLTLHPKIVLSQKKIAYAHRYCSNCSLPFFNMCGLSTRKDAFCLTCTKQLTKTDKIQEISLVHNPEDLRFSLAAAKLYLQKHKIPHEDLPNRYEAHICTGQFIGAYDNEACRGEPGAQECRIPNPAFNTANPEELFFANRAKDMKIVSIQQTILEIATKKPEGQEERNGLVERVKNYAKSVNDLESLKKRIIAKYDQKNLVIEILWALSSSSQIFD